MGKLVDLTDKIFGQLVVLERVKISGERESHWKCRCSCGNYVDVRSSDLLQAHTTSCGCRRMSYGEERIQNVLDDAGITYLYNKGYFKDLVSSDNLPLRYDFILMDSNNIPYRIIEFDGPQHNEPQDIFGGESKFVKQKENDKSKNQYAKAHNIPLVRIPYSERNNISLMLIFDDKYLI